MPIPTRQLSLREPNFGHKKKSSLERPTASRPNPIKSSISNSTSTSGGPTGERNKAQWKSSPTETTQAIPAPGFAKKDNGSSQRKSLLPQRSNSRRGDGLVPDGLRLQRQESRLRQPGQAQQQQEQQQDSASTARRQSPVQPVEAKTYASPKSGTKPGARLVRPPSPTKTQMAISKPAAPVSSPKTEVSASESAAPSSPKKSQMPPPARPGRSASLRQPTSSSSVTAPGSRGHVRHRSQVVGTVPARIEQATKLNATSSTSVVKSRPQFSTLQQHFSPKKVAKPPTPTTTTSSGSVEQDPFMIPSSRPDVAALQTELLQLHLFHSSSAQKNVDWKATSERKLKKIYDSVSESYRCVLGQEQDIRRQLNCQALSNWSDNIRKRSSRQDFAEQIQGLSHVVQEVNDITDPQGGRYTRTVRVFEDWFGEADRIKRDRKNASGRTVTMEDVNFIDPLSRTWKEELDVLSAKLELCSRKLQSLDIFGDDDVEQLENSALLRIANGHKELLASMVEELTAMRTIEADTVRLERLWVSNLVDKLQAVEGSNDNGPRSGIWKTY